MNKKTNEIQRSFLKKLLLAKAELVVIAFKKMQTLPERRDEELYAKANQFEKGLAKIVERTLKTSFQSFNA